MMLAHAHRLVREEGVTDAIEAVHRDAMERIAPIRMTALASGLGLLSLALAGGQSGSEIQTPMALVILRGWGTSTSLNMADVPALALRFGSARRIAGGTAPSPDLAGARTDALP